MQTNLPLILASGSPRRKEILDQMGFQYTVDVSDVDEFFCGKPDEAVLELSRRKACAVAKKHGDALVLAADTLVYAGSVLGKPHSAQQAKEMLSMLSGSWHSVFTGLALVDTKRDIVLRKAEETRVHFVCLSEKEIDAYIATGEPMDKAGAYGIQGLGGMFVDRIEGSYSNVVGLPMALLRQMMMEMDALKSEE